MDPARNTDRLEGARTPQQLGIVLPYGGLSAAIRASPGQIPTRSLAEQPSHPLLILVCGRVCVCVFLWGFSPARHEAWIQRALEQPSRATRTRRHGSMGADCGEQPMRGGTTKGGDLAD